MDFTAQQLITIKNALEVAADVYRRQAKHIPENYSGVMKVTADDARKAIYSKAHDAEAIIAQLSRAGIG